MIVFAFVLILFCAIVGVLAYFFIMRNAKSQVTTLEQAQAQASTNIQGTLKEAGYSKDDSIDEKRVLLDVKEYDDDEGLYDNEHEQMQRVVTHWL